MPFFSFSGMHIFFITTFYSCDAQSFSFVLLLVYLFYPFLFTVLRFLWCSLHSPATDTLYINYYVRAVKNNALMTLNNSPSIIKLTFLMHLPHGIIQHPPSICCSLLRYTVSEHIIIYAHCRSLNYHNSPACLCGGFHFMSDAWLES